MGERGVWEFEVEGGGGGGWGEGSNWCPSDEEREGGVSPGLMRIILNVNESHSESV